MLPDTVSTWETQAVWVMSEITKTTAYWFRLEATMILAGPQTILFDPTPLILIGVLLLMWPIVLFFGVRLVRRYPILAGIAVRLGVLVILSSLTFLFIQFYVIEFEPERRARLFKEALFLALLIPSPIYVPLLLAPLAVRRKDPTE